MNYRVSHTRPESAETACVAVGIFQSGRLSAAAKQLDQACEGYISGLIKQGDFEAETGQTLILYDLPGVSAPRVLLVGCGAAGRTTPTDYQTIHAAFAREVARLRINESVSFLTEIEAGDDGAWRVRQAVIACDEALYRFDEFKRDTRKPKLRTITLGQTDKQNLKEHSRAALEGRAIAEGVGRAKTLGNLPGNVCTPNYLAKQARALQRAYPNIKTTVLDEAAMKKHGMGSLLAVAQGSREPGRLIVMEYMQGRKTDKPVVIVGKGITFDSGGISIKPGAGMDEMKFDMCGAASVMGAMTACAQMKLKANVIGVIAAAENMPGGRAIKPGDIVKSMSGKTIEILNTDAEGRLVLCDALSYVERYKPAAVIDIATLTGACIIALGRAPSGLLGNDGTLVDRLKAAGETSGDRAWELPLWPEYRELLKSNFADLANIGNREAGTITAASFLSHFTEKYPWAHLDIAGTAWKTGKEKGATGRPVRLLMEYIMRHHG